MSLEEYSRKRTFSQTPEPGPGTPGEEPAARRFCIQRHAARRLHYDLRLEIGGTLKSWAVPQGPSLDPAVKRLAVHVEDHPIEYASFEGNIPRGNYGAGSMMLWDQGTFDVLADKSGGTSPEEQIEKGDLKLDFHGEKIRGTFALVRTSRGKGDEWLLIKKKDDFASATWDIETLEYSVLTGRTQAEIALDLPSKPIPGRTAAGAESAMPREIEPMLATPAAKLPAGPGWVYEVKWDGIRAIAFVDHGAVRMLTRNQKKLDRQFPEFAQLASAVEGKSAILDGEIVVLDEAGRPSFSRIQPRIMASDAGAVAQLRRSRPAYFYVFDLLYLDGRDLRGTPFRDRKLLLKSALKPNPELPVRVSEHFDVGGAELLEAVRAQGLEGVLAKRAASFYEAGRRPDWVKVKVTSEQEFVLCGFTEGNRDYFGALVLGAYEDGALHWVGNVGTGFDRKLMEAIHGKLAALETPERPFATPPEIADPVHWTRPELVCTVRYSNWTEDRRLRAPVFVGMRPDIDPSECMLVPAAPRVRVPLLAGDANEASVTVDGQALRFKNLNKPFYPEDGVNKRDVLNYYDAVADLLIPYWKDRPLSLRRYPDGIHGEGFFQKNADTASGFPDWMRKEWIVEDDGSKRLQVIGNGRAELLLLAHMGCIDQNPWMSRLGSLGNPDFILIDLDPYECSYDRIVDAARHVKARLDQLGLEGYPKTTGGDGMHIYIPLEPVYSYDQSKAVCEILARIAAADRPDLFTIPRAVSKREKGKVYFDYLQNGQGKTISAPYVLRAYSGAPVATPLAWDELRPGLDPKQFHIRNAMDRFDAVGDLFAGVLHRPQRLEPAIAKLDGMLASRKS